MNSSAPPLRIGLLVDEPLVPGWLAAALSEVTGRGIGEVVLVIARDTDPEPRVPRLVRLWRNRARLAFAAAQRIDAMRTRLPPGDPPVALSELAPGAATLRVRPETTRFRDIVTEPDLERIRAFDLDVLVRAGFRILRGGILSTARHGVWSFHHGDNRDNRGGPPGVWEVLEDSPVTGVTLQCLTEELDGGHVLARSVGHTQRFSFARNIRHLYPRSTRMLVRSFERAHAGLDPRQASGDELDAWSAYERRLYRIPRNGEVFRSGLRLARRYLSHRLSRRGGRLEWSLAWHAARGTTGNAPYGVMHRYREIASPPDRFRADPCIVRDGDRWWMFFEEFRYAEGRGTIAVWEMTPDGPVGDPEVVLRSDIHLSYPQVFRIGDVWYMIMETNARKRIELYRATRFPHEWTLDRTLIDDIDAADPTLLEHEGRWYLFASVGGSGIDWTEELHIFVAGQPFGPFTPHPLNPVVADVRRARMAGRFFRKGKRLFRPAQCAAPMYGAGLVIHEVLALTPERYEERVVQEIVPRWSRSALGTHTVTAADGISVIDLLRSVRS